MKKNIMAVLILTSSVLAQTAGNSGLSFLKLGFGARNIAMGELGVVAANDLTAFNYNPSLIAVNQKTQISFTHNSLFQDLNSEMLAASLSIFGLPIALGVNTTSVNDIEIRTKPGEPDATFNAHYFSASISTAHRLIENLYGGISLKYLYENIYTDDAAGVAFDFGLHWKGLVEGLSFGTSFRNFGDMNNMRNASTVLPSDLRIGSAYDFSIPTANFNFTVLAGFQKYTKEDESHFHFGGEAVYFSTFAVRIGYITDYDSKSITTGFGLNWKGLDLDYAYVPVKYGLGDSHIITFIYSFD